MLPKRCIRRDASTGRPAICSFQSSCPIRIEKPALAKVQPAQGRLSDGSNPNARPWFPALLQRHAFGVEHVPVVDQQPSEILDG